MHNPFAGLAHNAQSLPSQPPPPPAPKKQQQQHPSLETPKSAGKVLSATKGGGVGSRGKTRGSVASQRAAAAAAAAVATPSVFVTHTFGGEKKGCGEVSALFKPFKPPSRVGAQDGPMDKYKHKHKYLFS